MVNKAEIIEGRRDTGLSMINRIVSVYTKGGGKFCCNNKRIRGTRGFLERCWAKFRAGLARVCDASRDAVTPVGVFIVGHPVSAKDDPSSAFRLSIVGGGGRISRNRAGFDRGCTYGGGGDRIRIISKEGYQ